MLISAKRFLLLSFVFSSLGFSLNSMAKIETHKFDVNTNFGVLKIEVHLNSKDKFLAERLEEIAKVDLVKVVEYFAHVPRDIVHFNINTSKRLSNGNATNFPTNIVNIYNFPANNNEHLITMEDWWRGLILHEFTHIVHLDQTRDFLETGRKIFGNVAKIPVAVVPRWFAEGIAVWSESHLYKTGRLNNAILNKELWLYFNNPRNCSRIDCLDEPRKYPNGQLSYWAGAHFLDYIENLKAGSIRCLIVENSSAIPFILNRAFETCTGTSVYTHFDNFLLNFKKQFDFDKSLSADEVLTNYFGDTDYQKGLILDSSMLYKVERNKKNEALVSYDLDNKISLAGSFSHPISDLSGIVKLDEESNALVVSFNDDPNYKESNKIWKLINSESLTEEKILKFNNDPSYVLPIDTNDYLTMDYNHNIWTMKRIKINNEDYQVAFENALPNSDNIVFAKIINKKLVLKIYNFVADKTKLVLSDLDFKNQNVLYSSANYFDIFAINQHGFSIKEGKTATSFSFENDKAFKTSLDFEKIKNTSFSLENDFEELAFDNNLVIKKEASRVAVAIANVNQPEEMPTIVLEHEAYEAKNISLLAYPELEHFKPHYWFFSFGNAENISSLGAMTTLSDPMSIHQFSLSAFYYGEIARLGSHLSYVFDSSPYLLETNFSQDYSKSGINLNIINSKKSFDVNAKYIIEKKRITITPSAFLGIDSTSDFLSDRETKYFGGRGTFVFKAQSYNDFLRSVSLTSRLAIDTPAVDDSYINFQNRLDVWMNLKDEFLGQIRLTQGELYKSNYRSGVLYAGGLSNVQSFRWFEFYGLPYGNAYGNTMFTTRFKLDYNFLDIYKGHHLLPIYLKEIHLLGGFESLYTNVIYINDKIYTDDSIRSLFLGIKANLTLFYTAPVEMELIFANITDPKGLSSGQASLVINAELF